jgi:conjugal transfer mating pair stabilization protein TraN
MHCAYRRVRDPGRRLRLSLPLSFVQPTMVQHETDVWVDKSAALTEGGRCTVTTADRCVDGPATKTIDGRAVTRLLVL